MAVKEQIKIGPSSLRERLQAAFDVPPPTLASANIEERIEMDVQEQMKYYNKLTTDRRIMQYYNKVGTHE